MSCHSHRCHRHNILRLFFCLHFVVSHFVCLVWCAFRHFFRHRFSPFDRQYSSRFGLLCHLRLSIRSIVDALSHVKFTKKKFRSIHFRERHERKQGVSVDFTFRFGQIKEIGRLRLQPMGYFHAEKMRFDLRMHFPVWLVLIYARPSTIFSLHFSFYHIRSADAKENWMCIGMIARIFRLSKPVYLRVSFVSFACAFVLASSRR